ncbi:TIGR03905 family TSCPD domain-containing protein [Pseudodesulfovibrio sp. zrk46]|nr:TIGR03905 family TSCPD domain-containing protein [Pseudodesulfovibrio sp. zrk46]
MPLFFPPEEATTPGDAEIFVPEKVCAKMIRYAVEDDKVVYLDFVGGCDGNLKAISKLVTGMAIPDVIDKLSGITCGKKTTSCADQLCEALKDL